MKNLFSFWKRRREAKLAEHRPFAKKLETKQEGKLEGFHIQWTAKGRKAVLANRDLFKVFKHFRDNYPSAGAAPEKIDLGYATVERIAGFKPSHEQQTRAGVYRIRLKNRREFVFKDGNALSPRMDGHEIETAYDARRLGVSTVEHYAQIHVPNSSRYFVLTEYKNLPTLEEYLQKIRYGKRVKLEARFRKESEKLQANAIGDTAPYNCFVKKRPFRREQLIWFDLRKREIIWHSIQDLLQ